MRVRRDLAQRITQRRPEHRVVVGDEDAQRGVGHEGSQWKAGPILHAPPSTGGRAVTAAGPSSRAAALVGGTSAPRLLFQIAATGAESLGAEAPPTKAAAGPASRKVAGGTSVPMPLFRVAAPEWTASGLKPLPQKQQRGRHRAKTNGAA
ncbi:DUF6053 domain-containing protein [Lysobacter enzymogenes]|uniref:DUF6053 domain-containing protein n=1 Tax=Lysobacter enzymogenes TaxID=69 RepID=UPI003CCD3EA5